MKYQRKLGAMMIGCALASLVGAGCAMQTDDTEPEISSAPDVDESIGDAQAALWGYARRGGVYYGTRRGYGYRVAFTGGTRLYW